MSGRPVSAIQEVGKVAGTELRSRERPRMPSGGPDEYCADGAVVSGAEPLDSGLLGKLDAIKGSHDRAKSSGKLTNYYRRGDGAGGQRGGNGGHLFLAIICR